MVLGSAPVSAARLHKLHKSLTKSAIRLCVCERERCEKEKEEGREGEGRVRKSIILSIKIINDLVLSIYE